MSVVAFLSAVIVRAISSFNTTRRAVASVETDRPKIPAEQGIAEQGGVEEGDGGKEQGVRGKGRGGLREGLIPGVLPAAKKINPNRN